MPFFQEEGHLSRQRVLELVNRAAAAARENICRSPKRVLLLPPDITRAHSGAGWITEEFYRIFSQEAQVEVIPTLGQHVPHTPEQNRWMFGTIPLEHIHVHDWRDGVTKVGTISADFVKEKSGGKADWELPIMLNSKLMEEKWDLIINVGHIVPHEVLGFANHNKNYFIGLAGKETICASHMMAACCGIENNLGRLITPLRACYNKAEQDFLAHLPDMYFQVVMAYDSAGQLGHTGVYVGNDLETYLAGARASMLKKIIFYDIIKQFIILIISTITY